jgi:hypothetical protein
MAVEDTIGTWVPQLFYDVIGRLVPGAVIILSVFVILVGPASLRENPEKLVSFLNPSNVSTTIVVLMGLALSYLTAFVCRGLYHVARWSLREGDDTSSGMRQARLETHLRGALTWMRLLILKSQDQLNRTARIDSFARKYDFIKLKNPSAGARMTKLQAEQHMIGVLQVGWIICALIGIVLCWWDPLRLIASIILLLFCFGLEAHKLHLLQRTNTGVENYPELLGFVSEPVAASSPGETSIKEARDNVE